MGLLGVTVLGIIVFCVPGALFAWITGLRAPWSAALGLPISFGIYGFAGWLTSVIGVRYNLISVIAVWCGFLIIAALWRWGGRTFERWPHHPESEVAVAAQGGRSLVIETPLDLNSHPVAEPSATATTTKPKGWRLGSPGGLGDPIWLLPAAGVLVGMLVIMLPSLQWINALPHGMDTIFQGWDVLWHANVVRWIDETGIADPTRMGELHNPETHQAMYYPVAWHAGTWVLAHLAGLTPNTAINYSSVIIPGIILPVSGATVAWRLINDRGIFSQIAAASGAVIVTVIPAYYWVGNYVGAWPYTAALCASGVVLAAFMAAPYRPIMLLSCGLSFMGLVQLHPAAATVVITGLGLWWLCWLVWKPVRTPQSFLGSLGCRLRDVLILAAGGIIGILPLLPQLLGREGEVDAVASFSATEDLSTRDSILEVITMTTRHVNEGAPFNPAWILLLAAIGAIALVFWWKNIWALLFYLLSAALTYNALTPLPDPYGKILNLIGQLHYATPHRLIMPVALLTATAAGVGLAAVLGLIFSPLRRWAPKTGGAVLVVLSLTLTGACGWFGFQSIQEEARWSVQNLRTISITVTDRDRHAFNWLAQQPRAYQGLIMHDPSDGAGWMYALNGLPSVARHYHWPLPMKSSKLYALWRGIDQLGTGAKNDPDAANHVDQLAKDLDIRYLVLSPPNYWDFQKPWLPLTEGTYQTPGLTLVYKDAEDAIFVVNAEFSDEEINAMRSSGESPDPLPHQPTLGELGLAKTPAEINKPYYHRPGDGRT
ncbi:hypothetical protein GP475_02590 [Corynebacterium poyangense]|uniref:Uncharacterized protein n=1 Tax=Corynebacterium poyangense TaxID=2684405 RepID=A0A7H0SM77_9CORY|nr:DUF6541 family protein [Corynebacterium poyangense]QNQ89652.1 hypothetical protein GP475_02590 [Corynebacterium poyangense]